MRLLGLFLILALLVIVPFLIWGDFYEGLFSPEGAVERLERFGKSWAWLAGVALILADLLLPIPGSAVMAALGYVYGFWLGGAIGAGASILSGLVAYGLCRRLGRGAAEWIAGRRDLEKGERLFRGAAGGWIVALSRWLPVMPEVIACLAGLARMPVRRFTFAVACGSIPLGFAFAAIGTTGHANPKLALLLSAIIPPLLWAAIRPVVMKERTRGEHAGGP
ncbi:MAG: VTT domain-containing protein [Akkermansiaceae bacterium]|nr:VTT domain-containing protein [Akkermansiaceae bacterium]NNM28900.1 VTT domain-containing protein [Akkermansiaceae bacterium]